MLKLIELSHPVLIVETGSSEVVDNLVSMGYSSEKMLNSPNILFKPCNVNLL
jgi:hypothetical protein